MDKNGLMYFVDATMIRRVDQNGIISTVIKTNDLTAVRPLSCDSSMDVSQVGRKTGGQKNCPLGQETCVVLRLYVFLNSQVGRESAV